MKTALELLTEDLHLRQSYLLDKKAEKVDKRKKAWKIHDLDAREILETSYGHILTALESRATLASLLISIGRSLNRKFDLDADEVEQAHLGWFVLVSYLELGYVKYIAKHIKKANGRRTKYPTYHLLATNMDAINSMMQEVDRDKVDLFPISHNSGDWGESFFHPQTR